MIPKLSNELEQCVADTPDGAIKVEGTDGATYWLMTDDAMRVGRYVQQGIETADRGDVSPWNTEEIIEEARKLHEHRSSSCSE
jgi:hypothetical protein